MALARFPGQRLPLILEQWGLGLCRHAPNFSHRIAVSFSNKDLQGLKTQFIDRASTVVQYFIDTESLKAFTRNAFTNSLDQFRVNIVTSYE